MDIKNFNTILKQEDSILNGTQDKGLRYDSGKLRYDLVNAHAHAGMVDILTFGATKYAERNWERGMRWSKVIASLERHLAAIKAGEDYDKESGKLHAYHVACNAHFLSAYYTIYPQGDDRPHRYLNQPRIGLDIDEVLGDWVGHWVARHGIEDRPEFWNFDRDIHKKFDEMKDDKEFWLTIPVKTPPCDIPFEPACYITSRSIPIEWTQEWLDKNKFPAVPVYRVDFEHSKVEVAKQANIDWYVDDRYENFVELNNAGICTFLFDAPHNRRYNVGYKRIKSLKELI